MSAHSSSVGSDVEDPCFLDDLKEEEDIFAASLGESDIDFEALSPCRLLELALEDDEDATLVLARVVGPW